MIKVLSIDMSTTCTGWSVFNDSKELLKYGIIKGKSKKQKSKWNELLTKMKTMAVEIKEVIDLEHPDFIVIEEIAGSKNRIGQKTLDMMHGILWMFIEEYLDRVYYYDVTGNKGWRTQLGLRLDDADKLANKEARDLNKRLDSRQKLPIIGPKHLSCRFASRQFNLDLDCDKRKTDGDIADSVSMGYAFLKFIYHKKLS